MLATEKFPFFLISENTAFIIRGLNTANEEDENIINARVNLAGSCVYLFVKMFDRYRRVTATFTM